MLAAWTLWYTGANLYSLYVIGRDIPVSWRPVVVGSAVVLVGVHLILAHGSR